MDNEIMNIEEVEVMDDEVMVENEGSGIGTMVAMAIGAGLTLAVGAGVKLGKKLYAGYKAKKEFRKPDHDVIVDEEAIEEVAK